MSAVRAWVLAALASVGLAAGARAAVTAEQAGASASAWCGRVLAAGWARPDTDVFVAQRVDSARGFWFVHVGQRWRELAVLPVDVCVVLDREGQVAHWSGELARVPAPSGPRTLAAAGAVFRSRAVARAALADPGQCEPVVWVGGGPARHAWRVRFEQAVPPAPGEVIVDGERGEVLASAGGALHAHGYVYPNDGRDALSEVSLSGLDGDGTVLRGGKVRVLDGSWPDLAAPLGDYRIVPSEPDTTRFDDVNVWWRVQGYLGWLHSLGYTGPRDTLHVRVHAPIAPEVAYTYRDYVYLGEAMAGFSHDAAKAADVTVHELQHFVATDYGLVHGTSETDALQEGLSDYMAAAYTGDARIGEWVYIPFPNGVTTVASSPAVFRYDNYGYVSWGGVDVGSTWANGMIFSGALWDLRGAIGATADSLVLEAMPRVTAAPEFGEFADGLATADRDLHAGAHAAQIRQAMAARGIYPKVFVAVRGPGDLDPLEPGAFTVTASSYGHPEGAVWTLKHLRAGVVTDSLVGVALGPSCTVSDSTDFLLVASVPTDAGPAAVGSLRVGIRAIAVGIEGPDSLRAREPGTFTVSASATLQSAGAVWSLVHVRGAAAIDSLPGIAVGPACTVADSGEFVLRVAARTEYGYAVTASRRVGIRPIVLRARGPARLAPGVAGTFTLDPSPELAAAPPTWFVRRYCGVAPCGAPEPVGTAWSVTHADTLDFDMTVVAASAWGAPASETLLVLVQVPQVAVQGPRYYDGSKVVGFSCVPSGAGPWQYAWTMYLVPRGTSAGISLGNTPTITAYSYAGTFDLAVTVRDARGRTAVDETRVYRPTVAIRGPASAAPGAHASFAAAVDTLFADMHEAWEVRRWCGTTDCGEPWQSAGSGAALDHASNSDYQLRLTVTGADGFALSALAKVTIAPPDVRIVPAGPVGTGDGLGYRADAAGAMPLQIEWAVRPKGLPWPVTIVGEGRSVVVTQAPPYDLVATVTDGNGRLGRDLLAVAADTSGRRAPPIRAGMDCPAVASGDLRLVVQTPHETLARLAVYDLGGREVARWFDGRLPGGERQFVRSTRELGQGVYFVRWRADGVDVVRRVAVVR